jgi:hypothetical protein
MPRTVSHVDAAQLAPERAPARDRPRLDWTRPLEYPSAAIPPSRLAWEFLRRSPAYALAWESQDAGAARLFAIVELVDPAADLAPEFTCAGVTLTAPDSPALSAAGRDLTGAIAITFDASRGIEPQIESAARSVRAWADRWRRETQQCLPRIPGTSRCVLALRCWDARAQGASVDVIAHTLFRAQRERPKRSTLDALALADRLIAGEYRHIAERETRHLDAGISSSWTAAAQNNILQIRIQGRSL